MFNLRRMLLRHGHACLTTLLAFAGTLFLAVSGVSAKTLTVGAGRDYATIGDALNAAKDWDLIEVEGGEYKEHLKIQKTVHLRGLNQPVIRVPGGRIVEVTRPGVIIEGFTLTYATADLAASDTAIYLAREAGGAVIRNNRLLNVMFGIYNLEGRDIRIEHNRITGIKSLAGNSRGNGINLTGSQRIYIGYNILNDCRDGIYMELCHDARVVGNAIKQSRYAIHTMWVDRGVFNKNTTYESLVGLAIMYTKHSEINENVSYGNSTHGLLFIQTVRSEIRANTVIGNTKGIFLYNSIYNQMSSNLVMNNQLGIHNWGGSEDNAIAGNSFINNEVQVKHVAGSSQQWSKNYWSDYIGWDMTGDGSGEYPYESNSVVDHILWRYPLAKVLYSSPSLQMLWMLEKQFPLFEVPRVVDPSPVMVPLHANWKQLRDKYPYTPQRFFGEIQKLPHLPGGGD